MHWINFAAYPQEYNNQLGFRLLTSFCTTLSGNVRKSYCKYITLNGWNNPHNPTILYQFTTKSTVDIRFGVSHSPGHRSRFCRFFPSEKGNYKFKHPILGRWPSYGKSGTLLCECTFAVKFNVRSWKTIFLYAWVDQLKPHTRVHVWVVCKAIHPMEIVWIPVREGYAKHFWDPGWDFPVGLWGLISGTLSLRLCATFRTWLEGCRMAGEESRQFARYVGAIDKWIMFCSKITKSMFN